MNEFRYLALLGLCSVFAQGQPHMESGAQSAANPGAGASLSASQANNVVRAAAYPGADCGTKINAADSAFRGTPVTIQFDQACGTSAWSNVRLSSGHSLECAQAGTYNIGTIVLRGSNVVDLKGFSCKLQAESAALPEIFRILGASQSSNVAFFWIEGGFLYANGDTASGNAAIHIANASNIHIRGTVIDGGWDRDIVADNFGYLYLDQLRANGAATDGIYLENTGAGPYFGGPAYLSHVQVDSCACTDAAISADNISSLEITDSEVVGTSHGKGLLLTSTNGANAPVPDYAGGIHVKGFTADTTADVGIYVTNIIKSAFDGIWMSSGRANSKYCMELGGTTSDISIINAHAFWCGNSALAIGGTASYIHVANSSFSASPNEGIHVVSATHSSFIGNHCDSTGLNGAGVTEPYCIYEEPTSSNNEYVDNDATGTTYGNHYGEAAPFVIEYNGNIDTPGAIRTQLPIISTGEQNISGCALSSAVGGAATGSFKAGATSCTVTITPGIAAPNGFLCQAHDITTTANALVQTGSSTTTCTLIGAVEPGDTIIWHADAF